MRSRRDDAAWNDDGVNAREGWRRETRAEATDRDETARRREGERGDGRVMWCYVKGGGGIRRRDRDRG